jgi:hypothetical protein
MQLNTKKKIHLVQRFLAFQSIFLNIVMCRNYGFKFFLSCFSSSLSGLRVKIIGNIKSTPIIINPILASVMSLL